MAQTQPVARTIPANVAYRTTQSYVPQAQTVRVYPTVDDYEPWYTQPVPNNRMLLALRSGIQKEIDWSLDRLSRLCNNDQFILKTIPGLLDALFEWPLRYLEDHSRTQHDELMFNASQEDRAIRRHGLQSLFVMRNASVNEANAMELAVHPKIIHLLHTALSILKCDIEADAEFLVHAIDILCAIGSMLHFPRRHPVTAFVKRLEQIAVSSNNRSLTMGTLGALTAIMQNIRNLSFLKSTSPTLDVAMRYLPLLADESLVAVCLEHIYVRLSNPPMLRAFLLDDKLDDLIQMLFILILHSQETEELSIDLEQPAAPLIASGTQPSAEGKLRLLSQEELTRISQLAEPDRSYEWLKCLFITRPDGELTQVEFWNLYKDTFTPYSEKHPLLAAAEVIKNVTFVFPNAQAMVMQGAIPRFVIRGIDRRKEEVVMSRFQCVWGDPACASEGHDDPQKLYDHLLEHSSQHSSGRCLWANCTFRGEDPATLRVHLLTHVPPPNATGYIKPGEAPSAWEQPPPALTETKLVLQRATKLPSSSALTALLIVRLVYRITAFTTDSVLRADEDHVGFPGVVEEIEEEQNASIDAEIMFGEKRGRRSIWLARRLMESVHIKDQTLMSWMNEMLDASAPA